MKQFSRNPLQAEFKPHYYYLKSILEALEVIWDNNHSKLLTTASAGCKPPVRVPDAAQAATALRITVLKIQWAALAELWQFCKCSEPLSPRSGHGSWARSVGHQSWLSLSLAGCGLPAWVVVTVTVPWPCVTVALPSARVQTWTVNHIELEVPSQLEVEVSSSMTRMIPVTVTVVASHCAPAPRASGAQAHRRCDGGTGNFKFEQLWVLLNSLRLRADSGRGSSSRLSWPSDGSSKRL